MPTRSELQRVVCAATGWLIRPRCRVRREDLNLTAVPAPHEAAAAQYYPASTGINAQDPARVSSLAPGRRATSASGPEEPGGTGWPNVKTLGCMSYHALGTIGHANSKELGCIQGFDRGVGTAYHVRTTHDRHDQLRRRLGSEHTAQIMGRLDRIGIAAGERRCAEGAERPQGMERQRGPHPLGWSAYGYLHDF